MCRAIRWAVVVVVCAAAGCAGGGGAQKPAGPTGPLLTSPGTGGELTLAELDQLTYGFADRYIVLINSATDEIKRNNTNAEQRRIAHGIKLQSTLAIYDIVTSNDPYAQVLDLVVAVTLQSRVWIDENRAYEVFAERAPPLVAALRTARVEAWDLTARVLRQDQLELVDHLILEWRRQNPKIEQVEFVKFDDFASGRAASVLTELQRGGGFLAPLSEMNVELMEYRRLAERAFWYSKRTPNVAGIQAEAAVNEILAAPEVGGLLGSVEEVSASADRLTRTAEALPEKIAAERAAVLAAIDERRDMIEDGRQMVADVTATTQAAERIVQELTPATQRLESLLTTADAVVGKYYQPGPEEKEGEVMGMSAPSEEGFAKPQAAKPFDIGEYRATIEEATGLVTELNQLTGRLDALAQSEGWRRGLRDVSDAADRRVDKVFLNVYAALALFFVLLIVYRVVVFVLARRLRGVEGGK